MRELDRLFGVRGVRWWRSAATVLVAVAIIWLGAASPVQALDLVVDIEGDSNASFYQACTGVGGDCSLRGAILRANAAPGPHTITVPSGTYPQTIAGPADTDIGFTGDFDIRQIITIKGAGSGTTIITGDIHTDLEDRDRIFDVAPAGNLTISDVTIRLGGSGTNGGLNGGGIRAYGPLVVDRASIRVNEAGDGAGLDIENTATIRDSAINSNVSGTLGGGLYVGSTGVIVLIENTTISGNRASFGGGIYYRATNINSVLNLNNVTVAYNAATNLGGGLRQLESGTLGLGNTIVASNTAGSPSDANCAGQFISRGFNLVYGAAGTCGFSGTITGDPLLGPQQGNGGPTANHALGTFSPAIDKGNNLVPPGSGGTACAAKDQRGIVRPQVGTSTGAVDPRCDIGAFEVRLRADLRVTLSDAPDPVLVGANLTYTAQVFNDGPDFANKIIFTDVLPPGVSYVSGTSNNGSCSEESGTVICDLGSYAESASATVTIVVRPTAAGVLSHTVTVSNFSLDPNTDNNSATVTTIVNPDCTPRPAVSRTVSPAGAGVLSVNLSVASSVGVPNNRIRSVSFLKTPNATLDFSPAGGSNLSGIFTYTLPTPAATFSFRIRRGSAGAFTANFEVNDACGAYKLFAGGGTGVQ